MKTPAAPVKKLAASKTPIASNLKAQAPKTPGPKIVLFSGCELTKNLKDSLSGDCVRTIMICTRIAVNNSTTNVLDFAKTCRKIKFVSTNIVTNVSNDKVIFLPFFMFMKLSN